MTPDPGNGHYRPARLSALLFFSLIGTGRALAGATAYLPLSLSPEVESRIERFLTLAGVPVMTRPIRVATVADALSSGVCGTNKGLCRQVRRDLAPYLAPVALTGIGVEVAATQSNKLTQPNQHGAPMDSPWLAYVSGIGQFGEHALITVGAVGNSDRITPTGTMVTVGWNPVQFDFGYRDHWWSPFRLGSTLIGTEAATMPSITVSNVVPFTSAHLRYEMFMGRMSYSNRIEYNGGYTAGYPQLFGFHIDVEPAPGWTLGVSRVMQYGGGDRPSGFRDMLKAFFNPSSYDNNNSSLSTDQEFGNQQVALTSEFVVPLRFPVSAYIEYAAEDTFHSENYLFGSSALSAGIYLPRLTSNLQLRYEFSEWQTNWYVHHIYQDGMTNYGVVLGQWGAQWRYPGDGVGAQSHALELIWDLGGNRQLDLQYRTVMNDVRPATSFFRGISYKRAQELSISASFPWRTLQLGARIDGGRDEYGDSFGRLAAFARFAGPPPNARYEVPSEEDEASDAVPDEAAVKSANVASRRVEAFVDVGMFSSWTDYEQDAGSVPAVKTTNGSVHLGLGVRRAFTPTNDFGTRIEFDSVDGRSYMALRAIDYRHRFGNHFAASFFLGAARYDALTPAYGFYGGAGVQWRDLWKKWDFGVDYRIGDHMARNKTSSEAVITWPNSFYTIQGVSIYISRRF